ncbi:hypothetical protein NA57DRAFT_53956 [Rhizodiscina lignyota]|uniref:Uncharacterized protein n=1 Tax=Rhizodiscina lignyota TaxID=1504668 RepID=A0A9P4ILN8_9PEZI|nr:hypothetical protein NA57DRAFT_53956 [Rhizodiscina lignyota]
MTPPNADPAWRGESVYVVVILVTTHLDVITTASGVGLDFRVESRSTTRFFGVTRGIEGFGRGGVSQRGRGAIVIGVATESAVQNARRAKGPVQLITLQPNLRTQPFYIF